VVLAYNISPTAYHVNPVPPLLAATVAKVVAMDVAPEPVTAPVSVIVWLAVRNVELSNVQAEPEYFKKPVASVIVLFLIAVTVAAPAFVSEKSPDTATPVATLDTLPTKILPSVRAVERASVIP
jgi:hypothetical protein